MIIVVDVAEGVCVGMDVIAEPDEPLAKVEGADADDVAMAALAKICELAKVVQDEIAGV